MDYIIAFTRSNSAIQAEQLLLEQKLSVGVLPLAPQIQAGCGICLRIRTHEIKQALTTLAQKGISEIRLFAREIGERSYVYKEITAEAQREIVNEI